MDITSIILLLAGFVLLLVGIFSSGKNKTILSILGLFILVFGGLGAFGFINFSSLSTGGMPQTTGIGQNNAIVTAVPSAGCSVAAITSNGLSQARVTYSNKENSTGNGFLAASVSANNEIGAQLDSSTTNAGSSGTSAVSLSNIPNCGVGSLTATVTTGVGVASSKKIKDLEKNVDVANYDFRDKAAHVYEVQGASGDVVSAMVYRSTGAEFASNLANGSTGDEVPVQNDPSVSGTGTADGNIYITNTTLGARGSINFVAQFKVNGTASVFGAYGEPDAVIFSLDTGTASRASANSLSLSSNTAGWSLNKMSSCPNEITSNRNAEACWSAPTMKAGVLYEVRGSFTADSGDYIVGDTMPSIYIDDRQYTRDNDNFVKYITFTSSGTNAGVGGTRINFVLN